MQSMEIHHFVKFQQKDAIVYVNIFFNFWLYVNGSVDGCRYDTLNSFASGRSVCDFENVIVIRICSIDWYIQFIWICHKILLMISEQWFK